LRTTSIVVVILGRGGIVTSIERTAYPRFKRLITAHELHLFFSPTRDELEWAAEATDSDEHLLALLLILMSLPAHGVLSGTGGCAGAGGGVRAAAGGVAGGHAAGVPGGADRQTLSRSGP
jgi:hypothetical protein